MLRSGLMRRLALTVTAGALMGIGGSSSTAMASAEGCTAAPTGYVCTYAHGEGTHLDRVDVIRGKAGWDGICGYRVEVTVEEPSGARHEYGSGVIRNGECVFGRAYVTLGVDRNFPDGSSICGRFYEHDEQQGGMPCVRIEK